MSVLDTLLPLLDGRRAADTWTTRVGLTLLRPAGGLYAGALSLRAGLYERGLLPSWRAPVPVIAIGNLASGGTGKTPMTLRLGKYLLERGGHPLVASRGYRQTSTQPVTVVSDPHGVRLAPPQAADEAALLARRLPGAAVLTGPRRRALVEYARQHFDVDVVLLDDAFQHLAVRRDLNILLMDARHPLGNGRTLPAGILRESPRALKRADLIVLTRGDDPLDVTRARQRLAELCPDKPVLRAVHQPMALHPLDGGPPLSLSALHGLPLFAACGIARPLTFFQGLNRLGLTVVGQRAFPDHHHWSGAERESLNAEAHASGAQALICTEKDAVRLTEVWKGLPVYALAIEMRILEGESLLWQAVDALFPPRT